ncbi:MAG: Hsp20/alpha crystallin family protein [Armatimonadetes bacterium]|nr:Hsp20/alpha crystallin family protein [Armatimonadota bacterium]
MEAMQSEMNRLFSRFGGFSGFNENLANNGPTSGSQWMLPVDVIETQDTLTLKAALPGVDPQDVNIEFNDNVLTITAQRRHEEKVEEGGYHWIEQQYGTFSRSLTLPRYADAENIKAQYNNGILELTVPKKESAKPRRIELQAGASEPRTLEAGSQPQSEPAQLQPQEATA